MVVSSICEVEVIMLVVVESCDTVISVVFNELSVVGSISVVVAI